MREFYIAKDNAPIDTEKKKAWWKVELLRNQFNQMFITVLIWGNNTRVL